MNLCGNNSAIQLADIVLHIILKQYLQVHGPVQYYVQAILTLSYKHLILIQKGVNCTSETT